MNCSLCAHVILPSKKVLGQGYLHLIKAHTYRCVYVCMYMYAYLCIYVCTCIMMIRPLLKNLPHFSTYSLNTHRWFFSCAVHSDLTRTRLRRLHPPAISFHSNAFSFFSLLISLQVLKRVLPPSSQVSMRRKIRFYRPVKQKEDETGYLFQIFFG